MAELPGVKDVVSQIGRPDDGTGVNGMDTIETFVTLKAPNEWKSAETLQVLVAILKEKLSGLEGVEVTGKKLRTRG